jgi:hypothetical protein
MGEGKCVEYFIYKTLIKGHGKRRHRWKYNVKIDLKETVCECVDISVWLNKNPNLLSCEHSDEPLGFCSLAF